MMRNRALFLAFVVALLSLAVIGCDGDGNTISSGIVTDKVMVTINADTPTGTSLSSGGTGWITLMAVTVTNISGDTIVLNRLRLQTVFSTGVWSWFYVQTDEGWDSSEMMTSPGEVEIGMQYSKIILLPNTSATLWVVSAALGLESGDQMAGRITGMGIADEFLNDVGIQEVDVQGPVRTFRAAVDCWSQVNAQQSSSIPQSSEVVGRFLLHNSNYSTLEIDTIRLDVYATDRANTDWHEGMEISLVNAKTGAVVSGPVYGVFTDYDYTMVELSDPFTLDSMWVWGDSGDSMEVLVVANTMGASQVLHDTLYVEVWSIEFTLDGESFMTYPYQGGSWITYVEQSAMPEVSATLAAGSPSGATVPGYKEELRFDVQATQDVTISGMVFDVQVTDNASTGWMYDLPVWLFAAEDMHTPLGWACYRNGKVYMTLYQPVVIPGGVAKRFVLKADTTGASTAMDDWEQFSLHGLFAGIGNDFDVFTPTPVQGGVLVN